MMKPNTVALIKLASSVYDMYPHETYAYRHNANNPEYKELLILVNQTSDEGKPLKLPKQYGTAGCMPGLNGVNSMSGQNYPGSYHILTDRPNIEGTGHGIPLGVRPLNPLSYT